MRPIPQSAIRLVTEWEGCKLKAYQDGAGVWTIGYGHTLGVRPGQLINKGQALKFLTADLAEAGAAIERIIGADGVQALTEGQYAALLSFVFNLGPQPQATLWKRIKAKRYDQVPGELTKFVNAGGRKLQGLVNRRAAEVAIWSMHEPGSAMENPPSSVTRLMDTPPTPTDPTPAKKSATIWATITAPFLGALAFVQDHVKAAAHAVMALLTPDHVNQGIAAISPYADKSTLVSTALQGLAVVGAVVAAVLVLRKHNEARG